MEYNCIMNQLIELQCYNIKNLSVQCGVYAYTAMIFPPYFFFSQFSCVSLPLLIMSLGVHARVYVVCVCIYVYIRVSVILGSCLRISWKSIAELLLIIRDVRLPIGIFLTPVIHFSSQRLSAFILFYFLMLASHVPKYRSRNRRYVFRSPLL